MLLNLKSQAILNHSNLVCLYTAAMSIGARIRQLRESHRLSGEKFGELCGGISKGAISQWENDDVTPPIDRLLELQKTIEFSIDWVYTGKISIADEISQRLGAKERKAWYSAGNSLAEPEEGTNGKQ
jgi:transcriptional regulator with XRE-family HTH domain